MNTSQIASHRAILDAEETAIEKAISAAVQSKSYDGIEDLERRTTALEEARAELKRLEDTAANSATFAAKMGGSFGDATDSPVAANSDGVQTGAHLNPLHISKSAMQTIYTAVEAGNKVSVKAFSTVAGLIPAQLEPNVLGRIHESRLLDRLPVEAISKPSREIIVHSSTTGAPTPVAEGATKPEVVINTTSLTLTAIKLAAHVGISYETLSDFDGFQGYAQSELLRQIQDLENAQLLSGSGTSGNMTGFLNTSGILTHDASTDTGTGVTVIDSIEKSIAQLRVGSALATADLLVLHPSTWSAIRRLKDTTGRMLFIASDSDPSNPEANRIFNVPVLVTTALAAGSGVMLDTTKFGRVLVREGITVHVGQNADDFARNISRFVMEERLVLAVERPSAVLAISNLPTS